MSLMSLGFTPQAVAALAAGTAAAVVLKKYGSEIGEKARQWLKRRIEDGEVETKEETMTGEGDSQGDELGK